MGIPRIEAVKPPADLRIVSDDSISDTDLPHSRRIVSEYRSRRELNAAARLERDRARGYSINVKQVVLAFAVEFIIIGLILVSQILYALDSNAGLSALLFPIALAMVELARVPLAIAVRTQTSWHIQFAALLGVACAVVVTSASLYQIGHYTFNPRLENVYEKRTLLETAQDEKGAFLDRRKAAQDIVGQKNNDWVALSDRYKALASQLNAQPAQTCTPTTKRNADGTDSTVQTCRVNPALKPLQTEINETKTKLTELESAQKQAQADLAKLDARSYEEAVTRAEKEYRDAIHRSPLHSYTGMLFGKDAAEVSEGQVKTLEQYLILIPSIAAAFSSTLIAITAVRRLRPVIPEPIATIPDEAAAFLFGPLIAAIRLEAANAVGAAVSAGAKAASPPSSAEAQAKTSSAEAKTG
jgi:hypothetical protein